MRIVIPLFTYTTYVGPDSFSFLLMLLLLRTLKKRHMASLKADQILRSFEKLISK